jgi:hypothetical protein
MELLQYFPDLVNKEEEFNSISVDQNYEIDSELINRLAIISNNPIEFINSYYSKKS